MIWFETRTDQKCNDGLLEEPSAAANKAIAKESLAQQSTPPKPLYKTEKRWDRWRNIKNKIWLETRQRGAFVSCLTRKHIDLTKATYRLRTKHLFARENKKAKTTSTPWNLPKPQRQKKQESRCRHINLRSESQGSKLTRKEYSYKF